MKIQNKSGLTNHGNVGPKCSLPQFNPEIKRDASQILAMAEREPGVNEPGACTNGVASLNYLRAEVEIVFVVSELIGSKLQKSCPKSSTVQRKVSLTLSSEPRRLHHHLREKHKPMVNSLSMGRGTLYKLAIIFT